LLPSTPAWINDCCWTVWRPGFVRRLQKLEKRLKIEPELCIQVTGTLRVAEVVEFIARRCIKSLKVDSNGRPVKEKENTSVGVDSYFASVGGYKEAEAEAEEVAVGVLCLLLMSDEAHFDLAKGEVEAHWQIRLGGQGQGAGHC
jgi:hypothetical protein